MVHGSPRVNGNSNYLLQQLVDATIAELPPGTAVVEHIHTARLKAKPCISCGGCDTTGQCVIMDEMQEVYTKVRQADLLLIGSPVFFASVSAQLKAVIDRFQAAWVAKYKLKRPWLSPGNGRRAALICVGGMTEERHYRQTRSVIRAWLATLNWELTRGLWLPGIDARGDAAKIDGIDATIQALAKVLTAPAPPDPTTPDGT